ncbi:MAG: hypothetical protein LBC83_02695 [Oscillospiraceae bacterium]|nr:hypothetical protein [Oscillospiraceae bacterium]
MRGSPRTGEKEYSVEDYRKVLELFISICGASLPHPQMLTEQRKRARLEWSVETMHWLLDVHFGEDFCGVLEQRTQENLNMIRKIVLNTWLFGIFNSFWKVNFRAVSVTPLASCG